MEKQRCKSLAVLALLGFISIIFVFIKTRPPLSTMTLPCIFDQTLTTMPLQRIIEERDKLSIQHNLLQVR